LSQFLKNALPADTTVFASSTQGARLASTHSDPQGKVGGWLAQRDEVLAFCSARTVDGGTGAVYVLLKKG